MNDKLLRAFIAAQGYEIEDTVARNKVESPDGIGCNYFIVDYKVIKKKPVNKVSQLHKLVREFELGAMSFETLIERMREEVNPD